MHQDILKAVRAGRFVDASRLLDRQRPKAFRLSVLRLEIDYFRGHLEAAAAQALSLLRASRALATRCRATDVIAGSKWELAYLDE